MSRTLRVFTNETCDLRCEFCDRRRDRERPELAGGPALRQRLLEAFEARADTLVLTGGEPTLRKDLPKLVAWIRARTDATLVLETHGAHLDVDALSGLDVVRVHLPAWGQRLDAFEAGAESIAIALGARPLEDAARHGVQQGHAQDREEARGGRGRERQQG